MPDLAAAAEQLRALHHAARPLVLANAWDAASARAVVAAGLPAVATTSVGIANVLGWADGEQTPPDEMFAAIGRIARVVEVPVTADIEAGYGLAPDEIVARLIEAGAVGCNLEDTDHATHTLRDAAAQAERLQAVRRAADRAGVPIVLNGRTDVFLRQPADAPAASVVAEAIRRGRLYLDAGADCVFPIGVGDEASISALVAGLPGPINVIAGFRGAPGQTRLAELGVRRVSYAGRLQRAMQTELEQRLAAISRGEDG